MPVLTLVSAKGSPGVTTAAAALAAAATAAGDAPALLVELDPAGGDVRILTGAVDDNGVVGAAGELRRDVSSESIGRHVSVAPAGLPVLLAPTAGLMATSVIGSVLDRWGPAFRQHGGTVVVDGGRWDSSQPTARRAGVGDLVALVCRPTLAGVEHARQTVDRLREVAHRPVVALVVGSRPYAPAEVAAELDLPLAGSITWDPRGTSALWAKGITRAWGRTWLAASAASTLDGLLALAPAPEPAQGVAPALRDAALHRSAAATGPPDGRIPAGRNPAAVTPDAGRPPTPPPGDRRPPGTPPSGDRRPSGTPPPLPADPPGHRAGEGPWHVPPPSRDQAVAPPAPDVGLPAPPTPAYGADRATPRQPGPGGLGRPAPPPAPRPAGPAPVSGEHPAAAPAGLGVPSSWRAGPQQSWPRPPEQRPAPGAAVSPDQPAVQGPSVTAPLYRPSPADPRSGEHRAAAPAPLYRSPAPSPQPPPPSGQPSNAGPYQLGDQGTGGREPGRSDAVGPGNGRHAAASWSHGGQSGGGDGTGTGQRQAQVGEAYRRGEHGDGGGGDGTGGVGDRRAGDGQAQEGEAYRRGEHGDGGEGEGHGNGHGHGHDGVGQRQDQDSQRQDQDREGEGSEGRTSEAGHLPAWAAER